MPSIVMLLLCAPIIAGAATPDAKPTPAAAASPAAQIPAGLAGVAPADRYFGPFGMSPLSIRSTIGLLGRQYHSRTISDHDLLRKALITEDALRKWRTAYPADPWLAPTFFHLEQLYQTVQSDESRKHATAILKDIVDHYPATKQGHLSRSRLAAGFPPLVAETPLVSSPSPGTPAMGSTASQTDPSANTATEANQAAPAPATVPAGDPLPSPSPK